MPSGDQILINTLISHNRRMITKSRQNLKIGQIKIKISMSFRQLYFRSMTVRYLNKTKIPDYKLQSY